MAERARKGLPGLIVIIYEWVSLLAYREMESRGTWEMTALSHESEALAII